MEFRLGPWLIRPEANRVERGRRSLHVTPKSMEVLVCLAQREGRVVPKDTLFLEVWPATYVTDDALTKCIGELRRVFRAPGSEPPVIETISKRGYRIAVPVTWNGDSEAPASAGAEPESAATPSNGFAAVHAPPVPLWRRHWTFVFVSALAVILLAALARTNRGWSLAKLHIRSGPPPIRSVAVLPLANLSGNPDQEYFADGMTEELITELARIDAWKVISRTSVMRYKATKKRLTEVARDLSVDAVVEGAVRRSGDRVRITIQLIHADTDTHLWAGAFERDMRDVLSLQGEIAQTIAGELRVQVSPPGSPSHRREVVPAAYEAYLKGCYFLHQLQLAKAQSYFDEATRSDAGFALAHAMLYEADALDAFRHDLPLSARALAALDTARVLEPDLAEAYTSAGDAKFYWDWDWSTGLASFRRAAELDPGSAESVGHYAGALHTLARWDAALEQYRRALQMDPVSPQANLMYLTCLIDARRYDDAVRQFERTVEVDPNSSAPYMRAGDLYQLQNRDDKALAAYLKADTLDGVSRDKLDAFEAAARTAGIRGYWKRRLEFMRESTGKNRVPPLVFATAYVRIGDHDKAMEMLEAAYQQRAPRLVRVRASAVWAPIRSDARFQSLLRRMRFPD